MRMREAIEDATTKLRAAGIENAHQEARWLLAEALGVPDASLSALTEPGAESVGKPSSALGPPELSGARRARFWVMVERRSRREPLQHVLGHWPFLELDLLCDPRALVPRPETEDLAELARAALREMPAPRSAVDVGTGSGCLALALAAGVPETRVLGIDVDERALSLARENAERVGAADRVTFVKGDLLAPLGGASAPASARMEGVTDSVTPLAAPAAPAAPAGATDPGLVVANLPYVAASEWERLQPEVRDHDPRGALVAEDDGLALLRRLVPQAAEHLRTGGALMLELAPHQAPTLTAWLKDAGFEDVSVQGDRFGRPRFVTGRGRGGA